MKLAFGKDEQRLFKKSLGQDFFINQGNNKVKMGVHTFWKMAFESYDDPKECLSFLKQSRAKVKEGAVRLWFDELILRFILFLWEHKKITLIELCKSLETEFNGVESRLFSYVSLTGYSNKFFTLTDLQKMNLDYETFSCWGPFNSGFAKFKVLELELFPSWVQFISTYESSGNKKINLSNNPVKYLFGYLLSLVFLCGFIYALFYNSLLEGERLAQKLNISIPSFEKIDNWQGVVDFKKLEVPLFDSQKIEVSDLDNSFEREGTETELEYLDFEDLKKRFSSFSTGKNKFEEETKGVFRETRYGYSTVYRLMVDTPDSFEVLNKLSELQKKFGLEKAGDVEPGTFIPGGSYYNLLVENSRLEKFFEEVNVLKPMIYASKSKSRVVPGKTKLFIFVNKI